MTNDTFIKDSSILIHPKQSLGGSLITIDLLKFIKQIKEEEQWKKNDRNAITVFKSFVIRMVLIALHKDAEIKQHKTDASISIQVIEGEMIFTTNDQTIALASGQILVLQEGIPHNILAKVDTVFLLTLTKS